MLKLKFYQIENIVLMKVLEQSEKGFNYCGENGFTLRSSIVPDINIAEKIIYLRGTCEERDSLLTAVDFSTPKAALDFIAKAQELVAEYNEKKCFQEAKEENLIINEFIAK